MCRNITILRGHEPPATDEEIAAAALQFVRKVSGIRAPSQANDEAFQRAVEAIAAATSTLLEELPPRKQPPKKVPPMRLHGRP